MRPRKRACPLSLFPRHSKSLYLSLSVLSTSLFSHPSRLLLSRLHAPVSTQRKSIFAREIQPDKTLKEHKGTSSSLQCRTRGCQRIANIDKKTEGNNKNVQKKKKLYIEQKEMPRNIYKSRHLLITAYPCWNNNNNNNNRNNIINNASSMNNGKDNNKIRRRVQQRNKVMRRGKKSRTHKRSV